MCVPARLFINLLHASVIWKIRQPQIAAQETSIHSIPKGYTGSGAFCTLNGNAAIP